MKASITTLAVALLAMLLLVAAIQSPQSNGFTITEADATSYLTTTGSSELNTLIGNIAPRLVVQWANAMRFLSLPPIPSELKTLTEQVGTRFIMQYANANRYFSLSYPAPLFGDANPPQVSAVVIRTIGPVMVRVTWMTDELATSDLIYGTSPGVYPQTISDSYYNKSHAITLDGLMAGNLYYFRLGGADRSDNHYQSPEYSFTVNNFVYLPLVKR